MKVLFYLAFPFIYIFFYLYSILYCLFVYPVKYIIQVIKGDWKKIFNFILFPILYIYYLFVSFYTAFKFVNVVVRNKMLNKEENIE